MTSLATSLRSLPKRQAGGANGMVTPDNTAHKYVLPSSRANLDHSIQARSPILKFLRCKPMQQRMGKLRV